MNSVTSPTMVASVPSCGLVEVENTGDEFSSGSAHETFELGRELMDGLLPIEHEPDHANDEQDQRRQGQGGIICQRGC